MNPPQKRNHRLAPEPPPALVETLRKKGVTPLSVGRSIVATCEPNEKLVLEAIHECELDSKLCSTRERAWCCFPHQQSQRPEGGARRLGIVRAQRGPIGDAENDHTFFSQILCQRSCAAPPAPGPSSPRRSQGERSAMRPPQARLGPHLPFVMRFRFLAAANLATVLAFSDCATAPSAYRTRTAVGVT